MNSGVDMVMLSSLKSLQLYITGVRNAIRLNLLTNDRLNDAVARIISVKLALGIAKLRGNVREET
jgi:beta-glucosidase-like glycosyl hydrolase